MRRIAVGLIGVAVLGVALFSAPLLWSQPPPEHKGGRSTRPSPSSQEHPVERGPLSDAEFGGFPDPGPRGDFRRRKGGPGGFGGPGHGLGGPGFGPTPTNLPNEPSNSPVVINEFLAGSSKSTTVNGEDWVELFNPSNRQIDLSGMYLSDSTRDFHKWRFPTGTTISPRGYLRVWCNDAKETASGLNASFKLSKKGEEIVLTSHEDGTERLVDQVCFEKQNDNVSYGRYPDGTQNWQVLVPSPNQRNRDSE